LKTKLIAAIALLALTLMPFGAIAYVPPPHIVDSNIANIEISKTNITLYQYFWINVTGQPNAYVSLILMRYIGNFTNESYSALGTSYDYYLNNTGFGSKKILLTNKISGPGTYFTYADGCGAYGHRVLFVAVANESARADYYEQIALDEAAHMSELFHAYYTERDYLQEKIFWLETALACLAGGIILYAAIKITMRKKEEAEDEN
jgi:hypothetical protein